MIGPSLLVDSTSNALKLYEVLWVSYCCDCLHARQLFQSSITNQFNNFTIHRSSNLFLHLDWLLTVV